VNTGKAEELKSAVAEIFKDIASEYATTDGNIRISIEEVTKENIGKSMTKEATDKVIYMLTCLPNGIQRMSPDVDGLVQTSLNMGILTHSEDSITLTFCVRSSVASEKDMLKRRLSQMMSAIGGDVIFEGDYPGWQYKVDSKLRDLMKEVYITIYNEEPEIEAVHAGVECGFFADKLPGLDCVSIGPNLFEIHTFRESMDIPSVGRTYRLVTETLKRIAKCK
jgi:dipeptidase D